MKDGYMGRVRVLHYFREVLASSLAPIYKQVTSPGSTITIDASTKCFKGREKVIVSSFDSKSRTRWFWL